MKQQSAQSSAKGAKPTHAVYLVAGEGKAAIWTKLAPVWAHRDGQGYGGTSALGRIVLRPLKQTDQGAQQ